MRPLFLALLLSLPALAEDMTVTVNGHGEAKVRPDRLEFRFEISARAEKAADAVTKIGEKSSKVKDSLLAAAKERKLDGASVTDSGLEFKAPPGNEEALMMGGGAQPEGGGEVMVETTLLLGVDGVDKLKDAEIADHVAAVIDAAVAAGATYSGGIAYDWTGRGPVPATVTFRISDPQAALARAWDAAAADAKKRAGEIAKRFGKEAGEVVKIEEAPTDGAPDMQPVPPGQPASHDAKFSGCGEATITADLKVAFRLK